MACLGSNGAGEGAVESRQSEQQDGFHRDPQARGRIGATAGVNLHHQDGAIRMA
jgi:hypothetical protein